MFLDKDGEDWLFALQMRLIDPASHAQVQRVGVSYFDVMQVAEALAELRTARGELPPSQVVADRTGCPPTVVLSTLEALVAMAFIDPARTHLLDCRSHEPLVLS